MLAGLSIFSAMLHRLLYCRGRLRFPSCRVADTASGRMVRFAHLAPAVAAFGVSGQLGPPRPLPLRVCRKFGSSLLHLFHLLRPAAQAVHTAPLFRPPKRQAAAALRLLPPAVSALRADAGAQPLPPFGHHATVSRIRCPRYAGRGFYRAAFGVAAGWGEVL